MTSENPDCQHACAEGAQFALSRRRFIQAAGATAGLAGAIAYAGPAYAASGTDHTFLVIHLRGGFDGLSAVAPAYDKNYFEARPFTKIGMNQGYGLDATFRLHPALASLNSMWDNHEMAVIQGVGYRNVTRSHFFSKALMDRASPVTSAKSGWMDRAAQSVTSRGLFSTIQLGNSALGAALLGNFREVAAQGLRDYHLTGVNPEFPVSRWSETLNTMYANQPEVLSGPAAVACRTLGVATSIRQNDPAQGDWDEVDNSKKTKPEDRGYPSKDRDRQFGPALFDLARIMKNGQAVQFASVEYDGWDIHANAGEVGNEAGRMYKKLSVLGDGIAAFARDIGPTRWNKTTVLLVTEFGRRVAENGSGGTDHGYGNTVMMFGGNINPTKRNRMWGHWDGLDDYKLRRGDMDIRIDYRDIWAKILTQRCGVPASALSGIFPSHRITPVSLF